MWWRYAVCGYLLAHKVDHSLLRSHLFNVGTLLSRVKAQAWLLSYKRYRPERYRTKIREFLKNLLLIYRYRLRHMLRSIIFDITCYSCVNKLGLIVIMR